MPTPKIRARTAGAHSQTSRIDVSEAPKWLRSLASQRKDGRDVVLVVADEQGQQPLLDLLRPVAREVVVASQLADATRILESRSGEIAAAILSSQSEWGLTLRRTLAAEYPEVRRVVLIV